MLCQTLWSILCGNLMIGWLAVATSLLHAEGGRWSSRDGAEAVKAFRPSTARRYPPVGLTGPSSACPACAGCPETKQEKSIRVLSYQARAGPDQKCDVGKAERASPKAPIGPKTPGWMGRTPCATAACVLHRPPNCFSSAPPPGSGLRRAASSSLIDQRGRRVLSRAQRRWPR